jgi:hypothetical protein
MKADGLGKGLALIQSPLPVVVTRLCLSCTVALPPNYIKTSFKKL